MFNLSGLKRKKTRLKNLTTKECQGKGHNCPIFQERNSYSSLTPSFKTKWVFISSKWNNVQTPSSSMFVITFKHKASF